MSTNVKQTVAVIDNNCLNSLKPEIDIGVSVIRVYAQIARYSNNPSRINEIQILRRAVRSAKRKKHLDYRYAIMKVKDAKLCFGDELNNFPKSALVISLKNE